MTGVFSPWEDSRKPPHVSMLYWADSQKQKKKKSSHTFTKPKYKLRSCIFNIPMKWFWLLYWPTSFLRFCSPNLHDAYKKLQGVLSANRPVLVIINSQKINKKPVLTTWRPSAIVLALAGSDCWSWNRQLHSLREIVVKVLLHLLWCVCVCTRTWYVCICRKL